MQGMYGPNVAVNVSVTELPTGIEDPGKNVAIVCDVELPGGSVPERFTVGSIHIAGAHTKLVDVIK
jgi:hypothetical protein